MLREVFTAIHFFASKRASQAYHESNFQPVLLSSYLVRSSQHVRYFALKLRTQYFLLVLILVVLSTWTCVRLFLALAKEFASVKFGIILDLSEVIEYPE